MNPVLASAPNQIQPSMTLLIVAGVLVATGVYLLLERALTRVLLGVVLMSNGVAVLYMVVSGPAKGAPLVGERLPSEMSDPLPQALVLTAIVISLATMAFVIALAYRQWQLTGSDDVPDDAEDAVIQRLAEADLVSATFDDDTVSTTTAEEDPDEDDDIDNDESIASSVSDGGQSAGGDDSAEARALTDSGSDSAGEATR